MRVAAIIPCRGRPEQTARNAARLLATAGMSDWALYAVTTEPDVSAALRAVIPNDQIFVYPDERLTYWEAMVRAAKHTDAPLLAPLANDLLPGRDWLARAVEAYDRTFADGLGVMGFNDGIHGIEHSPHFLIARTLLQSFGGWPVWYDHNFGDAEIVTRARELGRYAKAPWAVLYHDHYITGKGVDQVYQEGGAHAEQDQRLYETRRRRGWPTVD